MQCVTRRDWDWLSPNYCCTIASIISSSVSDTGSGSDRMPNRMRQSGDYVRRNWKKCWHLNHQSYLIPEQKSFTINFFLQNMSLFHYFTLLPKTKYRSELETCVSESNLQCCSECDTELCSVAILSLSLKCKYCKYRHTTILPLCFSVSCSKK